METKNFGLAIVYGVATIFIFAFLTSIVFSLLLRFTELQESSVTWIILIFSFIALFVGGFISGGKGKQKGWLLGAVTGLIFTGVVFLYQFLGHETLFTIQQTFYHIGFLAVAVLGGVFGVNVTSKTGRSSN